MTKVFSIRCLCEITCTINRCPNIFQNVRNGCVLTIWKQNLICMRIFINEHEDSNDSTEDNPTLSLPVPPMGRPVSKVGSSVTLPPLQRDLAREQRKAPEVSDRPHCDKWDVNFPHVSDHNCLIDPFLIACTSHELPSGEKGNIN